MKLRLSESDGFLSVELSIEVSSESCSLAGEARKTASQIAAIEVEHPGLCLDQVCSQLPPVLHQARLLILASLERMVLDSLRASLPNVQSSGTRDQPA